MKNLLLKFFSCSKNRQCMLLLFLTIGTEAYALNRKPASSMVPDEEVIVPPAIEISWMNIWLKDDDAGVMSSVRDNLKRWQTIDETAQNWNLEDYYLYETPDEEYRKNLIVKNIFKYADKRLAGEIRNAEEGSTMHQVGQVEKAIKPSATVNIANDFAVKFKARPLTGRAIMELRNPYFEFNTTFMLNGNVNSIAAKEFKSIGFKTGAEYQVKNETFIVFADQFLAENVKARVSSTKRNPAAEPSTTDERVEVMASFPFEF